MLFVILYGSEDFAGSADDLQTHLYDHFKDDLRSLPHTEGALVQHALKAFIHMDLVVRKPVFWVSDKASFKTFSSATETC